MKSSTSELDQFGRIVVPKRTRDELGLESGTRFEVRVEGGEVRLRPIPPEGSLAVRNGVLVAIGELEGDARTVVSRLREERLQHLSHARRRRS